MIQSQSPRSGNKDAPDQSHDETMAEAGFAAEQNEPKMENKSYDDNDEVEDKIENKSDDDNQNDEAEEEEEDAEEIIEDDQEMDDVAPSDDGVQKQDENAAKRDDLKSEPEKATVVGDNGGKKTVNEMNSNTVKPMDEKSDKEKKDDDKQSDSDSVKEYVVDKEALQAFRYFDHNRVGYIKVEDLRCLLHNLGKFPSHRDVKELVQSALFESNTTKDNRIFYRKPVKLPDI